MIDRRFVTVTVSTCAVAEPPGFRTVVLALADDGSLWDLRTMDGGVGNKWCRLPDLPAAARGAAS